MCFEDSKIDFLNWIILEEHLIKKFHFYIARLLLEGKIPEKLTLIQWTKEFSSWIEIGCPE